METQLPVLIVGAGPVGLSLALALIRQNIPVKVFEMLPELSHEARASTFHPRTLEMFDEWGVIDQLLERGYKVDRLQYRERESRQVIAEFQYDAITDDTPYPYRLQCPQSILTRLLKPIIADSPFGEVHMAHRLKRFVDDDTQVTATFESPDGETTITGAYLCAADGSKSSVRTLLGVDFRGMTYEDRFLLVATKTDFREIYPGLGPVCYIFDPEEWVIILHLPDVTRIVFRMHDEEEDEVASQPDAIHDRIERFVGQSIDLNIQGISIYNVHQRIAETFRVGRVLLLGDAAHINNPMGGMGMNSGIHDAYNLAQKLGAIYTAGATDAVLDEYNSERRGYALDNVRKHTDKNYQDMAAKEREYRIQRNREMQAIASDPARTRAYLLKASMLEDRLTTIPRGET